MTRVLLEVVPNGIQLKKLRLIFRNVCLFSRVGHRCLRHAEMP